MKKIIFFVFYVLAVSSLSGQTLLTEYEYWFNDNYFAKTNISISPVNTYQLQTEIECSQIDVGLNIFNIRFKDNAGNWSSTVSQYFQKITIPSYGEILLTEYEYWFNDDYSSKVNVSISPTSIYHLQAAIECNQVDVGLHVFNIRFKDNRGQWSSTISQYFQKFRLPQSDNALVLGEYWLNDNRNDVRTIAIDSTATFVILDSIDISSVTKATNTIHFRFQDKYGFWSSVYSQNFYRPVEIGFTHIVGLSEVTFTNTSIYADTYLWDFGDGTTSTQVNPLHTYEEAGAYPVKLIASNPQFTDSITHYVEKVGIRSISSNRGGNGGTATVIFYGGGLTDSTQVILTNGENQIVGTDIRLINYGELEVVFNLLDQEMGLYDIIVTDNTTFGEIILTEAYTVEETREPEVWAEIIGNNVLLVDRWQTYTISYGNNGNIDAVYVPLWIVFSDVPSVDVEFLNIEIYPSKLVFEINDTVKKEILSRDIFIKSNEFQYQPFACKAYPLVISKIPPTFTGELRIRIKTSQSIEFKVWIDEPSEIPNVSNTNNLRKLENNNPRYHECMRTMIDQNVAQMAQGYIPIYGCISDLRYWVNNLDGIATGKVGLGSLLWNTSFLAVGCVMDGASAISSWTIAGPIVISWVDIIVNSIGGLGARYFGGVDCRRQFPPLGSPSNSELSIQTANSFDPNEIIGVSGYGEQNYIQKKRYLNYTVYCENDPEEATAPAQEILIIDTLDLTKFNPEEFSFGTFTFRDITVEAIPNITEFSKDIDMRDNGENIIVRITATFDKTTGIIRCHFIAFDPVTMDLTESPFLGVLYPNTEPPIGEGNFTYRIGLLPSVTHGDIIENQAHIIFDLNEPIATNVFINTIDTIKPVSTMSFQSTENDSTYIISWHGTDDGSGVRNYTIYVSENSEEEFLIWQYNTTETSAAFVGNLNSTYRFYCIATDNVGNRENIKPYEVEISMLSSGISKVLENSFVKIYPNPTKNEVIVESTVPIQSYEITNAIGVKVASATQHNATRIRIDMQNYVEGVYFIKLKTDKETITKKVVKN